jgi:AmmeMemoRadiSam system protein B
MSETVYDKPCLRYCEAIPVQYDQDVVVVLRDPEQLFGETMAVALPMFMIMTLFDGRRDLRDIQAEIQRQFKELIPLENIEAMVRELDEFYLLDNERSMIRREDLEREFARMSTRPAAHAGMAYPDEPTELGKFLEEFFRHAEGPREASLPDRAPRGLITPHIDLRQGGPCMAWGFHQLRVPAPPELYVILGVAHHPSKNLYTLTSKDFETPLGPARVNREAAERLKALYGANKLDGEYAHKFEHSVEFQAVFLKHLHRDGDFSILPILCGSLGEEVEAQDHNPPIQRPEVGEFCRSLRTVVDEFGPRVCIIAGVDLSHVGLKFGDPKGVDQFKADLVRAADLRMLDLAAACDPEAFFDHFRADRNARHVDAVSAVYTMLHALGGSGEGKLLRYDQYREGPTQSLVSFASLAIY